MRGVQNAITKNRPRVKIPYDRAIIYVTKTIRKLHTSVISRNFTHNVLNKTFLNLFLWLKW
jgi:hypothetical protein